VLRFAGKRRARDSSAPRFAKAALQFQRAIESIGKQGQSRTLNEIASTSAAGAPGVQRHSQLAVWIEYAKEAEENGRPIADRRAS